MKMKTGWYNLLKSEFDKDYMIKLSDKIKIDIEDGKTIYPRTQDIYRAFDFFEPEHTRVVILGQDPYHGPNEAHGLAFSVNDGIKIPSSLRNIFKEIKSDIGNEIPISGDLSKWAEQGVLLLNSFLTVEEGKPGSHKSYGWETFTDSIINKLSDNYSNIVFILWGNYAKSKSNLIDASKHLVLTSAHPSGLSAHRGFFGSKLFSQTNDYLVKNNLIPIDW